MTTRHLHSICISIAFASEHHPSLCWSIPTEFILDSEPSLALHKIPPNQKLLQNHLAVPQILFLSSSSNPIRIFKKAIENASELLFGSPGAYFDTWKYMAIYWTWPVCVKPHVNDHNSMCINHWKCRNLDGSYRIHCGAQEWISAILATFFISNLF